MTEESSQSPYSNWSNTSLISRIHELEQQLHQYSQNAPSTNASESEKNRKTTEQTERATVQSRPRERSTSSNPPRKSEKKRRKIDPSKYSTRHIALKFAYLGKRYNGLEHANGNFTEVPTIEEELWKALRKTRLIFPAHKDCIDDFAVPSRPQSIHWDGCQYSKCGRTDKGVSAFGQVIGIRVRSLKPAALSLAAEGKGERTTGSAAAAVSEPGDENILGSFDVSDKEEAKAPVWDDIADELPYIQILNGALPEDIRVLAWCPHPPPDFDARFSCRQRRYRYFFTQPAFCPAPGARGIVRAPELKQDPSLPKLREGWLDIEAMREAAQHFVGSHDFRNFCKVDTSKQITNFVRRILRADIELVDPQKTPLGFVQMPGFEQFDNSPRNTGVSESVSDTSPAAAKVYSFTVHGTAFLWHQIRHMVGILFLVGQGLEPPSIVPQLLDVTKNPRRPVYEMASDSPLVLWDCIFGEEEDELDWVYPGDPRAGKSHSQRTDGNFGQGGIVEDLWSLWRNRKIDELLAGTLLESVANRGQLTALSKGDDHPSNLGQAARSPRVFSGGDNGKPVGKYVPLLERTRLDPVEDMNARYLSKKGHKYWNRVLEYQEEQRKAALDAE
ncbi:pseudouridine synthase deg1 [Microsporum audouinii]